MQDFAHRLYCGSPPPCTLIHSYRNACGIDYVSEPLSRNSG